MGWWSASILGGDTPLDFLGDFADIVGVGNRDDEDEGLSELYGYNFSKEILNDSTNLSKMLSYADKRRGSEYQSIAYQVLAVILMATGANISQTLKNKISSHSKKDEWYLSKDPERVAYIEQLIGSVELYKNGLPIILQSEGLFEKISQHLADGKTGLVNK